MSSNESRERHPLFTVIIPTKNRADYLMETLKTCSAQDYDNLVILVSDDHSTDHTMEVVLNASRQDSRIRYVKNQLNPGMRDNFEFALNQVKSGFVMALGGDDGLMPGGISGMCDTLWSSGMELLSWGAPVYSYPGARGSDAQLFIYHPKKDKIVESQEFLERQAKHLNYLSDIECPMTYVKGVSSTRLIEKARSRSKNRRFYACPTPDGYSGIVLAGEVSRFAFSKQPFSIYGLSPASQGLNYKADDEVAKKNSSLFFRSVESVPMHAHLASQPYSPLITLMTVDYLLTASDLHGWGGGRPQIDFKKVIEQSIKELAHGLYDESRLLREIEILANISAYHGLRNYFDNLIACARRDAVKPHFLGSGISRTGIFFDARKFRINNIHEAAYAATYLQQFAAELTLSGLTSNIKRSISYYLSTRRKGSKFPRFSR